MCEPIILGRECAEYRACISEELNSLNIFHFIKLMVLKMVKMVRCGVVISNGSHTHKCLEECFDSFLYKCSMRITEYRFPLHTKELRR